jgi:hypothetical protein
LFKENRLGAAMSRVTDPGTTDSILALCSVEITSLHLTDSTRAWLRNRVQASYVGELLNCSWTEKRDEIRAEAEIRTLLLELGLPIRRIDLDTLGWVPPYMNDPDVLRDLSAWTHERMKPGVGHQGTLSRKGCPDCFALGQVIRNHVTGAYLPPAHVTWNDLNTGKLRRGMFIPANWTPASAHVVLLPKK